MPRMWNACRRARQNVGAAKTDSNYIFPRNFPRRVRLEWPRGARLTRRRAGGVILSSEDRGAVLLP